MSSTVVINSNNVIGSNNSNFQYNFIGGSFVIPKGSKMAVSQVSLPYSWFNINSALYNNNTFQYTFSGTTYTVTIPNGFYAISDINQYLQNVMITNGHYLINSSGQYVYYIVLSTNATYYANQFLLYSIPTSLPAGYTNPGSFPFSSDGRCPQIIISSNNFGKIIGFTSGTYPSTITTSNTNYISNTTPNATPVNSLVLRCNLVENNSSMPTDILDSFPITSTFGSNIVYQPQVGKYVSLKAGTYSNMTLVLQDQNFNTIQANDPNLIITLSLLLGEPDEKPVEPIVNKIKSLTFN
jgi:hypothetical protein